MPQLSITVTAEEQREIQDAAGAETVSNYVRGRLGLPALARGRAGRQNDEVCREALRFRRALTEPMPPKFAKAAQVILDDVLGAPVEEDPSPGAEGADDAHELRYEPAGADDPA